MEGAEGERGQPCDRAPQDPDFDQLLRGRLLGTRGAVEEEARLRHLLDAVVLVSAGLSLDGVLTRIVKVAGDLVGARYVALGVLSSGSERRVRTFVHHGVEDGVVDDIGELPAGHGLLGLLIDEPHPVRLDDIATHPASAGFPPHHPSMATFIGVPIHVRDRVFGNLYLTEKVGGGTFTENDEAVVVALASAAGVAIENASLYERTAQRQEWQAATAEITTMLLEDISVAQALQVVADRARSVSGADVTWVVTGAEPDQLHLEVVSGAPLDLEVMQRLPMQDSLASIAVQTRAPVSVDDVAADPRAVDPSSIPGWPRLGPVMVLPMVSGDDVVGALALAWTSENSDGFHQVEAELPASFAEHATLAFQVARSRADRQRLKLYEDRDRIGRDLHDLVIQRLFGIGLGLHSTASLVPEGAVTARLNEAIDDLDDTIKDIRRTIFALGMLDTATDIQSEIERLVDRAGASMKLRPKLRMAGPVRSAVTPELAPDLLAVLGEAITNVGRHAHASSVEVQVTADAECIEVRVADDGCGMGPDIVESGLENLRARAHQHGGDLVVASGAGGGTTVTWRVPLSREDG